MQRNLLLHTEGVRYENGTKMYSEMSSTKGALLFNGWSCGGVHYVASIASYCSKIDGGTTEAARISVISVSTMAQLFSDESEEQNYEAAIKFDSATNLSHFKQVFDF